MFFVRIYLILLRIYHSSLYYFHFFTDKGSKKTNSLQKNGGGNFRILDFLNLYGIVCVHTCAQRVYVYYKEFDGELKVKMFKTVKF